MYKKTNVIIIMLLLCFMMIITPIQLLEAKKKRGGKKKRGRKKKRDHIVDERIDKVMQFSEQLVKDGHLFDGIQLVQTVWQQLKLPLYKKMKLKHRHSIEQLLKKYKYQNKSLYTLVKQTENKFELSKKIIEIHFHLLVTLHSAGDIKNAKVYLLKMYKGVMKLNKKKTIKKIFPQHIVFVMVETLFQYRMFQHVIDIYKKTKTIYGKKLWSIDDSLKRYILMSQEKLNLLISDGEGRKNFEMIQHAYRKLVEASSCKKNYVDKCGYVTSPIAPEARRLVFIDYDNTTTVPSTVNNTLKLEHHFLNKLFPTVDFNRNDIDVIEYNHENYIDQKNIFIDNYVNKGRPVILRGFVENNTSLQLSNLLKTYGKKRVSVSNSANVVPRQWIEDCRTINCKYLDKYNALFFQHQISIEKFVSNIIDGTYNTDKYQPPYFFGPLKMNKDEYANILGKIRNLFPTNLFSAKETKKGKDKEIFFIGSIGSGAYFHSHEAAANILFRGKKKWFLLPPMAYSGPGSASMEWWIENLYNILPIKPLEVVQNENDLLYIPPYYKHATINIDKIVIGVAFQHIGEHKIDLKNYDFAINSITRMMSGKTKKNARIKSPSEL